MSEKSQQPEKQDSGQKKSLPFSPNLLFLLLGVALAFTLLLFRENIWNDFIISYFWEPVEADAGGNKSAARYNPVNTLAYGLIMAGAVYGIYLYFNKIGLKVDTPFILAIVPFMILGSVTRSLEDAELFETPLQYVFISPLIYIFLGIVVLLLVFYHDHLGRWHRKEKSKLRLLQFLVSLPILGFMLVYLALFYLDSTVFAAYLHPAAVVAFCILMSFLASLLLEQRRHSISLGVGVSGLFLTGFFLLYVCQFVWFETWYDDGEEVKLWVIPAIVGLTILVTGGVYGLAWVTKEKKLLAKAPEGSMSGQFRETLLAFKNPLNIGVLFAQLLDAAATFVGIDHFGYQEKHVLPDALIQATGTAFVMFPLKLVLVFFIIYFMDVAYRKELEEGGFKELNGLLKLCVIILGLAPGMRDMLRLAMGV